VVIIDGEAYYEFSASPSGVIFNDGVGSYSGTYEMWVIRKTPSLIDRFTSLENNQVNQNLNLCQSDGFGIIRRSKWQLILVEQMKS